MQLRRALSGLTLIEILLSLVIASMILMLLIPQQLQSKHDQLVDKTVSEMNQIALAARNYYQESRAASLTNAPNATYWPQTLTDLSTKSYLPAAALCSSWPSATTSAACKNLAPYAIFPNNGSGQYDTTTPGILANGLNAGGNFWGVSLTLPNAKTAEEVQQKLPFATLCNVTQLKTGTACSSANNSTTVTAIVPRPSLWPQQVTNLKYANDGLIQSIGVLNMCNDSGPSPCSSNKLDVTSTISMPTTCDLNTTTPVLFVYPSAINTKGNGNTDPTYNPYFPGYSFKTTRDNANNRWIVQARSAQDTKNTPTGTTKIHSITITYFTVCAPNGDPNKWDASNFIGASSNGVNW